jgi:hypothetical protein
MFSLEPREGRKPEIAREDIVYRQIPVKADLGLPDAVRHRSGTADLEWDAKALVWLRRGRSVVSDDRAPPETLRPRVTGGEIWEVWCGRVRLWILSCRDHHAALEEMSRLARGDVRDLNLRRVAG